MSDKEVVDKLEEIKKKSGRLSSKVIKATYPEIYEYLSSRYKDQDPDKISEILFRMKNHIETKFKCPVCGNMTKYSVHISKQKPYPGYLTYCSNECRYKAQDEYIKEAYKFKTKKDFEEITEKRKKTCREKYGKDFVAQVDKFKEKSKATCLEKYGVEYSYQSENNKQKSIETKIKRYGSIENAHRVRTSKTKKTVEERYGVATFLNTKEARKIINEGHHREFKKRWKERGYDVEPLSDGKVLVRGKCKIHPEFEIELGMLHNRWKFPEGTICPICNPIGDKWTSSAELATQEFLKEYHIEFVPHERGIVKKNELDLYIPSKKIAFEINGVYWHSLDYCDKYHHFNKQDLCRKAGISLYYIWEDWIVSKQDLVFDYIKDLIGIQKSCIQIESTEILGLPKNKAEDFLYNNSLYYTNLDTSRIIGLYSNKELLGLLSYEMLEKEIKITSIVSKIGYDKQEIYFRLIDEVFSKNIENIGCYARDISYYLHCDIENREIFTKLGFMKAQHLEEKFIVDKKTMLRAFSEDNGNFICYSSGIDKLVKRYKKEE